MLQETLIHPGKALVVVLHLVAKKQIAFLVHLSAAPHEQRRAVDFLRAACDTDGGGSAAEIATSSSGRVRMAEKFILVWTNDGETTSLSHSTQDNALRLAEKLLREHGCDLEIALHLDRISPSAFVWFNKRRMQNWCLDGFPTIQI
jgi:hypothetical protein